MESKAIPNMFYLDGKLHKKLSVNIADDNVFAWSYQEEKRKQYSRSHVRQVFKKAYTVSSAANLINTSAATIKEIIRKGMLSVVPENSYDINTYAPLKSYICEDDMLELRQVVWDQLKKNRFGEPYKDTMVSADELTHRMKLNDQREFIRLGKDNVIRIFRDEDYEV